MRFAKRRLKVREFNATIPLPRFAVVCSDGSVDGLWYSEWCANGHCAAIGNEAYVVEVLPR